MIQDQSCNILCNLLSSWIMLFFSFIRHYVLALGKYGGKQKVKAAFHLTFASDKIDFWIFLISDFWRWQYLGSGSVVHSSWQVSHFYIGILILWPTIISAIVLLVMNTMMKRSPPYRWWSWSPWPAPSPPPRPPPPGQRASSSCTPDQQSSWWWWRLWWWWSIDHGINDDDYDDADADTALCICC